MNVSLQPTNFYFSSILTDITDPALAAPTILAAARVILGQNLIVPSLVTSYADLGECDFTGYARGIVIVWGLPINDVDTTPTSNSPAYLFARLALPSATTCKTSRCATVWLLPVRDSGVWCVCSTDPRFRDWRWVFGCRGLEPGQCAWQPECGNHPVTCGIAQ